MKHSHNIFQTLTWRTLKANRVRTLVTIIGIILSTAMITAVCTIITSMQQYMVEIARDESGDWYAAARSVPAEELGRITEQEEVESYFLAGQLGYSQRRSADTNPDKPYVYVLAVDNDFIGSMPVEVTTGRLPENSQEILVPEHLIHQGDSDYPIGRQITLPLGEREGGLDQNNPYTEEEKLQLETERTYTVVGYYLRPRFENYYAPGYTLLTKMDTAGADNYEVYYKVKHLAGIWDFAKETGFGTEINTYLIGSFGVFHYENMYVTLYGMGAVVLGIILLGSIALIYNAFAISVTERTRQFGLLTSIGATFRQLRSTVLREALLLSVAGIPLGIGSGIVGISITLKLLENSTTVLAGMTIDRTAPLMVHVEPIWCLLAAAIALVTVLLSAYFPAKRVKKITAMDALRQNQDVKVSYAEFKAAARPASFRSAEGLLAKRYFKRSRKKFRVTIFSLVLSMILFGATSSFCSYVLESAAGIMGSKNMGDIMMELPIEDEKKTSIKEDLEAISGEGTVTYIKRRTLVETPFGEVVVLLLEAQDYTAILEKAKMSDGTMGLLYDEQVTRDGGRYYWTQSVPEDVTALSVIDEDITLPIGARLKEIPEIDVEQSKDYPILLLPADQFDLKGMGRASVYLIKTGERHKEILAQLYQYESEVQENWTWTVVRDIRKEREMVDSLMTMMQVFFYGFIVLISLVAIANVFNTIATNLALRRREFAVLRSVGMESKGIFRIACRECILYGSRALAWGLPLSAGLTGVLYLLVAESFEIPYYFPWGTMGLMILGTGLAVLLTVLYAAARLRREQHLVIPEE